MPWSCSTRSINSDHAKGPRGTTPRQLRAHTRKVTALAYQPRSGTALLASGYADGNACLWRPERSLKLLREGWLAIV